MKHDPVESEDLLDEVMVPLDNINYTLASLVDDQEEQQAVAMKAGLRRVLATVQSTHEFLLGLSKTADERREPQTPDQLRAFVAQMAAERECEIVRLPVRRLENIEEQNPTAKGGQPARLWCTLHIGRVVFLRSVSQLISLVARQGHQRR